MSNLIDTGWAAWLPFELIEALEARSGRSADRRALRERLERGPSEADEERWERFRLVCPSRIDLPADARGLTTAHAESLLDQLGLLDAEPEPVELVLTLDNDDVRELERDPLRPRPGCDGRDAGGNALARRPLRRRQGRPQRSLPLRLRQEVQALPRQLTRSAVTPA